MEKNNDYLQEDLERLKKFRPIDDTFMRCLFRDNLPLAQFVLRILTEKPDLVLTEVETQKDLKRLVGSKSAILDVLATDSTGKLYNLEIERSQKGCDPHRGRYHHSILDVEKLRKGKEFKDLPENYVIFFMEHDYIGRNQPFYLYQMMDAKTHHPLNDGTYTLFINGDYQDETELGKLIHDFKCSNPDDMFYKEMADGTRYWKESQKGVSQMCEIMEELRDESMNIARIDERKDIASEMIQKKKFPLQEIAEMTKLSLEEVESLRDQLNSVGH